VAAVQRDWLFVDASRNYFGEMPLLFTRPLRPVHRRSGGRRRYDISGSTLNTADIVDLRRSFDGPVEVGDVLASFDAGAYSISRASRYAGLSPAVYLLGGDGEVRLIRRAESFEDLVAPMVVQTP
jgi:diaminopimelate decarboxylase